MAGENTSSSNKALGIIAICVVITAVIIAGLKFRAKQEKQPDPVPQKPVTQPDSKPEPKKVLDYNKLEQDNDLNALMKERKAKYGIENGIDLVVKSDESLKVGDKILSMEKILDETRLKQGDLVEKNISNNNKNINSKSNAEELGVYVVQKGDNIWNIHFRLLKDYFDRRQISLSPAADEPKKNGSSTGVGKILKFSEGIVYIYNLNEETFDTEINVIQPLSKIVIYRMGEVFALLEQIDYKNVNRIQFDGEVLWIPGDQ